MKNITVVSPKGMDKNQWFICESIREAKNIHDTFEGTARVKTFAAGKISPEDLGFGEFKEVSRKVFRGMIEEINEGNQPFVF